jgi:hypothetical protein
VRRLVAAIRDHDERKAEKPVLQLARTGRIFAPLVLAAGAFVMLFNGLGRVSLDPGRIEYPHTSPWVYLISLLSAFRPMTRFLLCGVCAACARSGLARQGRSPRAGAASGGVSAGAGGGMRSPGAARWACSPAI